jgi:UDP-2,3-diacylglucosamine pyrophosphatase LpxH
MPPQSVSHATTAYRNDPKVAIAGLAEADGQAGETDFRAQSGYHEPPGVPISRHRRIQGHSADILILVSDLHLRAERGSHTEVGPSQAFVALIEALTDEIRGAGAAIELLFVGDMLELTRLELDLDAEGALVASLARFGRIADAHTELFDSLGRFVAAGGQLRIIVGNHDLDLAHPALQEQFLARLGAEPARDAGSPAVTFHAWFAYVSQVVYAEHGHRYHDLNAASVPDGTRVPCTQAPDDTPLLAYADGWIRALWTGHAIGAWTRVLLKRAISQSKRRARPASPTTDPDAADNGLDPATVAAIDRLEAHIGPGTFVRVAAVLLGPPTRQVFPYIVAAILGRLALGGRRTVLPAWTVVMSAAGLASLVRHRHRYWPPQRSTSYALAAARALAATLERADERPSVIVLGHTHVPTTTWLTTRGRPSQYLNTGSWTLRYDGRREYPYVRITRTPSGEVQGELRWWPQAGE